MAKRKKLPYEFVADAMHGVDDTIRDTIVYPDNHNVVGISEGEDFLVLSHKSSLDEEKSVQQIWINTDNPDAVVALYEACQRLLLRKEAKLAGRLVDLLKPES